MVWQELAAAGWADCVLLASSEGCSELRHQGRTLCRKIMKTLTGWDHMKKGKTYFLKRHNRALLKEHCKETNGILKNPASHRSNRKRISCRKGMVTELFLWYESIPALCLQPVRKGKKVKLTGKLKVLHCIGWEQWEIKKIIKSVNSALDNSISVYFSKGNICSCVCECNLYFHQF